MCWRDDQSDDAWWADFRRIQAGYKLQKAHAKPGDVVNVDEEIRQRRKFFRRQTVYFLSGPLDTTEVLFTAGTKVVFRKIPEEARAEFKLPQIDLAAEVVVEDGKIGFVFCARADTKYFPLARNEHVQFEVRSVPGPA